MYTAHHIDWTKPSKGNIYPSGDIELLTAVYSALKWKKHNGQIILHTDSAGYAKYSEMGLLDIWDSVEVDILNNYDFSDVNYKSFWAAAKVAVIDKVDLPAFIIDLDFVVMDTLSRTNFDNTSDLAIHNLEKINTSILKEIYLNQDKLLIPEGYNFPTGLDWNVNATTCNFYYMNSASLRDEYVSEAFKFMRKNPTNRMIFEMVFAEQRLLMMLAKKNNCNINLMLNQLKYHDKINYWGLIDPKCKIDLSEDRFTIHLGTNVRKTYYNLREKFSKYLCKRIYLEFSEIIPTLNNIDMLKEYLEPYVRV